MKSNEVYLCSPESHINVSKGASHVHISNTYKIRPNMTKKRNSCCTTDLFHKRAWDLLSACAWRAAKYIPNCCPILFVTSVEKKLNLTVCCSTLQGYRGLIWIEIRLIIHGEIPLPPHCSAEETQSCKVIQFVSAAKVQLWGFLSAQLVRNKALTLGNVLE